MTSLALRPAASPGGRFEPLVCALSDLTIEIDATPPADPTPERLAAWDAMRRDKPRLFNGGILSYTDHNPRTATLRARRDTYMNLLTRAPGAHHLAVTGMLTAPDDQGRPCALMGLRSAAVGVHAGLWEFAPGGGIDAPERAGTHNADSLVRAQLEQEIQEELGLTAAPRAHTVLGLAFDLDIPSADVLVLVEFDATTTALIPRLGADRWEYDQTRWVPFDQLSHFETDQNDRIIAPARAVIRAMQP